MPARWSLQDLLGELSSMATLLEKRGKTTEMTASLAKGFCNKLEAAATDLGAAALLSLSDHLAEVNLPEACVDQISQTLDNVCMMDGAGLSALQLTTKAQTCDYMFNYLTKQDWKVLENEGLWPGAHVLVRRLRLIGINSLKEGVKKMSLGILTLMELKRTGGRMPKYRDIYKLGGQLGQSFSASNVVAPKGVRPLLNYPAYPQMISEQFIALAYSPDDPPVEKILEDLNYLILNHIPVRSTSKLLRDESEAERCCSAKPSAKLKIKVPTAGPARDKAAFHLAEANRLMALEDDGDCQEDMDTTAHHNFQLDKVKAVQFRPPSFTKRMDQPALPAYTDPEFLALSGVCFFFWFFCSTQTQLFDHIVSKMSFPMDYIEAHCS